MHIVIQWDRPDVFFFFGWSAVRLLKDRLTLKEKALEGPRSASPHGIIFIIYMNCNNYANTFD